MGLAGGAEGRKKAAPGANRPGLTSGLIGPWCGYQAGSRRHTISLGGNRLRPSRIRSGLPSGSNALGLEIMAGYRRQPAHGSRLR